MAEYKKVRQTGQKREIPYAIGSRAQCLTESAYELDLIRGLIAEHGGENYDGRIREYDSWWVFYHLSGLRRSLLAWYPFEENSALLEIGAGFGALTGLFCDRCKRVAATEKTEVKAEGIYDRYRERDNLTVYLCDYDELPEDIGKFDYIVLNGVLDRIAHGSADPGVYRDFIDRLADRYLSAGGKILFSVPNRYGIRYFCGAREPHTGKPFDGLNAYPKGTPGYSFSRQEIRRILDGSRLKHYKFYYPLPDYEATQLVYTDEYMEGNSVNERAAFYYAQQDTLIAIERKIYGDLMDNGVLNFFSNSFLVECGTEDNLADTIFAVISADRGEESALATSIHRDDKVRKRALSRSGREKLRNIFRNAAELKARGIETVCQELNGNIITMPRIHQETLSQALLRYAKSDKDRFVRIIDLWYDAILKSSDETAAEDIPERFRDKKYQPVLKKAYLDMVPVNCFLTEEDKLLFFDQEFWLSDMPAKFVLYRGLKYLYMSDSWIEKELPAAYFKKKYDLLEIGDTFEELEKGFIAGIRNADIEEQLQRWTGADRKGILKRPELFEYRGENICSYQLPENTKKQQKVEMDLLFRLKTVCEKHHIRFFLFYGSLLGAVRHSGFIPWDDDVDVAMLREDYDRFCEIAKTEFSEPYFFQCPESEESFFGGGYGKLRNSSTTALQEREWGQPSNQGMWIDIFPLDYCWVEEQQNEEARKKIFEVQLLMAAKCYGKPGTDLGVSDAEWALYRKRAEQHTWQQLCESLHQLMTSCREAQPLYVTVKARFVKEGQYQYYYAEDFRDTVSMKFEYLTLPVPGGYERCLEIFKGTRYMNYPREKYRKGHHKGLFSEYIPYNEYLERFSINFDLLAERDVVLAGEGAVLAEFWEKYGKKYRIRSVAALPGDLTEGLNAEVKAIDLKAIRSCLNADSIVIICSGKFVRYEKALNAMGVREYKIFISSPALLNQKG